MFYCLSRINYPGWLSSSLHWSPAPSSLPPQLGSNFHQKLYLPWSQIFLVIFLTEIEWSVGRYCVDCQTFLGCLLTCPSSGGAQERSDGNNWHWDLFVIFFYFWFVTNDYYIYTVMYIHYQGPTQLWVLAVKLASLNDEELQAIHGEDDDWLPKGFNIL